MTTAEAAQGIADSHYARKSRALVELMDKLRSLGASSELDLPRICVIGNQSAGKSSLVEAISGIKVPRDQGTCTRCPMEVRLRHATTPWSCRVFLRMELNSDGSDVENVRETPFGPVLNSPDDVEDILRRAQLAILNPSVIDSSIFLQLSDEEILELKDGSGKVVAGSSGQLGFSENLVCVDISGPSISNLGFLDLPGIIANSEVPGDIELIEGMCRRRITGNCLIIVAITMRDDYQNQKAVVLAKEADPEGRRTIGVLTKADLVQSGEHASWIDLLEGRKHPLVNGYYVTKQPAPEDLKKNLSFEDARAIEAEFFKSTAPWNALASHKNHLGTGHLTRFLSDRLGRYIAELLPSIQEVLNGSLSSVREAVKSLPPAPTSDPRNELQTRIGRLVRDLDSLVGGRDGHLSLIQDKNANDEQFATAIKVTRPVFTPFAASEQDKAKRWQSCHDDDAGLDCDCSLCYQASGKPAPKQATLVPRGALAMNLTTVRSHIAKHKGREVPLNTPYGAKATLFLDALRTWAELSTDALERLRVPVMKAVNDIVQVYFGPSTSVELRSKAKMAVSETINAIFDDAQRRVDYQVGLEKRPYTLNSHYFSKTMETVLTEYREARQPKRLPLVDEDKATLLALLAKAGYPGGLENLPKLEPKDEYEEELDAMAQTMAYWTVAYKRIIDDIPRVLDCSIIDVLPSTIQSELIAKLLSGDKDSISRLMAEEPEAAEKRAELNVRLQRLEDAQQVLVEFGHDL